MCHATCKSQEALGDRVNRGMRGLGLKAAIIIVGAGVVMAVPTLMVLRSNPTASIAPATSYPAQSASDDADLQAQRATRIALARATPTATLAPTPTAAAPVHGPAAAPPPPAPAAVPSFSHVFVIVMENHEYNSVVGNPAAPYTNGLVNSYGLATNYYGASHPSLPNYLALTAGSTFGIASDCTTCFVSATNIADQVEGSGRSWKAYMEDMPVPCYMGASSGNYAMKHNPFMYYNGIRNNSARCAAHVAPFTQFWVDMSSGHVPDFVWITPNMCNDTHDCPVGTGDAWLRTVVPTITGSAAFRNGGVLFITWDEGSSNAGCCSGSWGGHVATLVIAPNAIGGFRSAVAENHYGLLRTVEDGFHLSHLGAAGWASNLPLREYFRN
ncbi:MAG: phosphatidylinositol-3-phosphatase [Chloroflexota bacterium]|nr:phosphatidylinositol-3-phosphatase [Chloroflexota bacterium]